MTKSKDVCEIVIILDRSGSMQATRVETEAGFNRFLAEQKAAPGKAFISLYQFDSQYEVVYEGKDVADAPNLTLVPRYMTALFDAMGKTLTAALARITDDRKVIIVTLTDGGENASHEHTSKTVADLIAKAQAKGWQTLFIGANQDAILTAKGFNLHAGAALSTVNNAAGVHAAYASMSANTTSYRAGLSQTMDWTANDRLKQKEAATA